MSLLPVARSYCGASSSSAEVRATEASTLTSTGSATAASIAATEGNSNPPTIASPNAKGLPVMVLSSAFAKLVDDVAEFLDVVLAGVVGDPLVGRIHFRTERRKG